MNPLPQYSLPSFQKYEPYILHIILNHPSPTIFQPNNVTTFCWRLRDAVRSIKLNHWKSSLFTHDQANAIFRNLGEGGTFIFTITEQGVYVGPPIRPDRPIAHHKGTIIEIADAIDKDEYDARDTATFDSILCLKRQNLIIQPIKFRNVSNEQRAQAEHPNIEFFEDTEGLYIMI